MYTSAMSTASFFAATASSCRGRAFILVAVGLVSGVVDFSKGL